MPYSVSKLRDLPNLLQVWSPPTEAFRAREGEEGGGGKEKEGRGGEKIGRRKTAKKVKHVRTYMYFCLKL